MSVDCPHWYLNEQSFDRKIQWIEEDGKDAPYDYSFSATDPNTKLTLATKISVPASDDQIIFAEGYIDFKNPAAGEVNWGLIKFKLEF